MTRLSRGTRPGYRRAAPSSPTLKKTTRTEPPTPPPPPLPTEWPDHSEDLVAEPLFYVRETIDAAAWEAAQTKEATEPLYQVLVSGLPNLLLSEQMCEAMIEQSGFNVALRGFKASQGMHVNDGQVLLSLDSMSAAQWCAYYFHERQWGGATVTAEVIAPSWEQCTEHFEYDDCDLAAMSDFFGDVPDVPEVPLAQQLHNFELPAPPHDREADANSASAWLEEATQDLLKERRMEAATSSLDSTNASSRDGESESGDEVLFTKVGPVAEPASPPRKVKG